MSVAVAYHIIIYDIMYVNTFNIYRYMCATCILWLQITIWGCFSDFIVKTFFGYVKSFALSEHMYRYSVYINYTYFNITTPLYDN